MACKNCRCPDCKPIPKCPVCGGPRVRDDYSEWVIYCPVCRGDFVNHLKASEILWDEIPPGKRAAMEGVVASWGGKVSGDTPNPAAGRKEQR